jgi:hypothetical protein
MVMIEGIIITPIIVGGIIMPITVTNMKMQDQGIQGIVVPFEETVIVIRVEATRTAER